MAKLDSAKEKIGDGSLLAWVYQSYDTGKTDSLPFVLIVILELTAVVFWIHSSASPSLPGKSTATTIASDECILVVAGEAIW